MTKPKKEHAVKAATLSEYDRLPEPTAAQMRSIAIAKDNQEKRPTRSVVNVERRASNMVMSNPHKDGEGWNAALRETFATSSNGFTDDCTLKLSLILEKTDGGANPAAMNSALAMIGGFEPANEAQAAIAVQIVVNHFASLHLMNRALLNANASNFESAGAYVGMSTKASRTMVAQIEALAKLRGGGKQIVEHRYYQVNATNAVVGDHAKTVFGPPGVEFGNERQSCEPCALEYAPGATLSGPQSTGEPLPVSGYAGAEALPIARREEPRRAEGEG